MEPQWVIVQQSGWGAGQLLASCQASSIMAGTCPDWSITCCAGPGQLHAARPAQQLHGRGVCACKTGPAHDAAACRQLLLPAPPSAAPDLQCGQVIRGQVFQQAGSRPAAVRVQQCTVAPREAVTAACCAFHAGQLLVHPAAQRAVELVKRDAAVIVGVKLLQGKM